MKWLQYTYNMLTGKTGARLKKATERLDLQRARIDQLEKQVESLEKILGDRVTEVIGPLEKPVVELSPEEVTRFNEEQGTAPRPVRRRQPSTSRPRKKL